MILTDVDDPSQAIISHDDHNTGTYPVIPFVNKLLHRYRMLTMLRWFCLSALYASVSGFTAPRNAFLGNHVTSRYVQRLLKFIFISIRLLDDRYCQYIVGCEITSVAPLLLVAALLDVAV